MVYHDYFSKFVSWYTFVNLSSLKRNLTSLLAFQHMIRLDFNK